MMNQVKQKLCPRPIREMVRKVSHVLPPYKQAFAADDDNRVLRSCIAYNRYGGYCVPLASRHRLAAKAILSGRVWESDTVDFMRKNAGNGDIVHAGTFFGDFLPALAGACGQDAKVWAFEPNEENFRCAWITMVLNDLKNIELRHAGLGVQAGMLPIVTRDARGKALGGGSKLVDTTTDAGSAGSLEVDVVSLDEVLPAERHITILQLDVEGFERQALTGAMETVKRCKPILILESLPELDWLSENILNLGYRVVGKVHDNSILIRH